MSRDYAVEFNNVSKIYEMKIKDKNKLLKQKFYALKDISFKIPKGEIVGILGTNGSGKSTLSKILSGLSEVDSGKFKIDGEASLIAIKSGLNKKLTGYENIELKGALLGLSKEKIKQSAEAIIEFSELGDFIHQPVKTYSSGMKSKLGFAISINMNPDIIIVDEALSVGDQSFSDKCFDKIKELYAQNKTIFFVSHSVSELKKFCTLGIWIEGGELVSVGKINDVAAEYSNYIKDYKSKSKKEKLKIRDEKFQKRIINSKDINSKKSNKKISFLIKILLIPVVFILFILNSLFLYSLF